MADEEFTIEEVEAMIERLELTKVRWLRDNGYRHTLEVEIAALKLLLKDLKDHARPE